MNSELEITESDKEQFAYIRQQLGAELTPFYDTDFNLKRWLVGWHYDMTKVIPKLRLHLQYRKCMKLDDPVDTFKVDPIMAEYYAQCYFDHTTGVDETSLLSILCLGKIVARTVLHTVSSNEFLSSRVYYTETSLRKIMDLERKTGKYCGMTHILDAEGSVIDQWTLKAFTGPFKDLSFLLQENYVEITRRIIVINAGNFVYTLWKLIQPFLAQRTREKVQILSSNWREEILQFVSKDSLPVQWGGTLEGCEKKMVIPRPIPESLFYKKSVEDETVEKSMIVKNVPRGSFLYDEILVDVDDRHSIRWFLKSDSNFTFGIFYSPSKVDVSKGPVDTLECFEMVHPKFVIQANIVPDRGSMKCVRRGFYYVEYGNINYIFSQNITCSVIVVDDIEQELD